MGLSLEAVQDYNQRLFNTIYGWLSDHQIRQQIAVMTAAPGLVLPPDQLSKPHVLLSVDMIAAHHLQVHPYGISFSARFGGKSANCQIPWGAIIGFRGGSTDDGQPAIIGTGFLNFEIVEGTAEGVPVADPKVAEVEPAPVTATVPKEGNVVNLFDRRK